MLAPVSEVHADMLMNMDMGCWRVIRNHINLKQ